MMILTTITRLHLPKSGEAYRFMSPDCGLQSWNKQENISGRVGGLP